MAYCTREDIEAIYGKSNVSKWADMDNTGDPTEVAARIDLMCDKATAWLNNRLRGGPYAIPFLLPYDTQIVDMAARMAAYMLYMGRPVDDEDSEGGANVRGVRKDIDREVREILGGRVRLTTAAVAGNVPKIPTFPTVPRVY